MKTLSYFSGECNRREKTVFFHNEENVETSNKEGVTKGYLKQNKKTPFYKMYEGC